MQLYVIARANYDRMQQWIHDISAQIYTLKAPYYKDLQAHIQVRPIWLLELAFQEEYFKEVLGTVRPYDYLKEFNPHAFALRKLLHLKPIQKIIPPNFRVDKHDVGITGIGWRKDKKDPVGREII